MSGQPSPARVVGACIAATGAAAAPILLLGGLGLLALPYALLIAGGHMLVFGLPTYLIMRARQRVDWNEALIAGFLIGAVPLAALQLLLNAMRGYLGFSLFLFFFGGVLGMVGGAVFRAVVGPPADEIAPGDAASIFQ